MKINFSSLPCPNRTIGGQRLSGGKLLATAERVDMATGAR